jgi:hypothetical protein
MNELSDGTWAMYWVMSFAGVLASIFWLCARLDDNVKRPWLCLIPIALWLAPVMARVWIAVL